MIRPDYRLAELVAVFVWGLFGMLLVGGALHPEFDPVPALAEVHGWLLLVAGLALVLALLLNFYTELPIIRFETTRWKFLLASDMARICGLCATAYAALSMNPVAIGWAVIGVGFSLAACARMWVLWLFLRKVHQQRALDKHKGAQ